MLDTIIPVVRDILVIGYLFILRIGVPLLITLMLGSAAKKWLEASDAREALKEDKPAPPAPVESHS
jgi:hypothetical protein